MVNETILGALKSALVRGESLKKAMMTLYNAGYKKEEISEAARAINENGLISQAHPIQQTNTKQLQKPATAKILAPSAQLPKQSKQPVKQIQKPQILPQHQPIQQVQQQVQQPPTGQKIVQTVSGYGQPPKPGGNLMIIILGFLLLFLMGILVTIFLFKEELLNFFNNLFS